MRDSLPISVTIPENEAAELVEQLKKFGVEREIVSNLRQSGEDVFVTIILPCILTAVQVISAYIISRSQRNVPSSAQPPELERPHGYAPDSTKPMRIKVGKLVIGDKEFSLEAVEKILGRKIDDA